jgi:hypothetical protein
MVCARWIGGRGTVERARELLGREPVPSPAGPEYWPDLSASDVVKLAEVRYSAGLTSAEVERLAAEFPDARYWWILEHDY